jgi:hypothetical protein
MLNADYCGAAGASHGGTRADAQGEAAALLVAGKLQSNPESCVGLLAFGDEIKPGAQQAIATLHALGIRTAMLSGDNRGAAQLVAAALGIQDVRAEVLPGDKAEAVATLRDNVEVTLEDMGFLNASQLDFRMKVDAPVFTKVPGFKPIPFEKIGLYSNEYRPSVPPRSAEFRTLKSPKWTTRESKPKPAPKAK